MSGYGAFTLGGAGSISREEKYDRETVVQSSEAEGSTKSSSSISIRFVVFTVLLAVVALGLAMASQYSQATGAGSFSQLMSTFGLSSSISTSSARTSSSLDGECVACVESITSMDCMNTGIPVLGGVDVVQYWTDFKISDGVYNESRVGTLGSPNYISIYSGYQFNFVSADNQQTFESDPSKYAPKFGGFCAWGVGGEYCPEYSWAADCLGPSGDWGIWTIHDEKLYFFFKDEAKDKFNADPDAYGSYGDTRWSEWFGGKDVYSTKCFVSPSSIPTNMPP